MDYHGLLLWYTTKDSYNILSWWLCIVILILAIGSTQTNRIREEILDIAVSVYISIPLLISVVYTSINEFPVSNRKLIDIFNN